MLSINSSQSNKSIRSTLKVDDLEFSKVSKTFVTIWFKIFEIFMKNKKKM